MRISGFVHFLVIAAALLLVRPALAQKASSDILLDFGASPPVLWTVNNAAVANVSYFGSAMPAGWNIAGIGDFDGNGLSDILWTTGIPGIPGFLWLDKGGAANGISIGTYATPSAKPWIADFNGDGKSDILWDMGANRPIIWSVNGSSVTAISYLGANMPAGWKIAAVGDFSGNRLSDVVWTTIGPGGPAFLWVNQGGGQIVPVSLAKYGNVPGKAWVGDFNGDGKADILWDNGSSKPVLWTMNGSTVTGVTYLGVNMPAGWSIAAVGDFSGDGLADVLWTTGVPGQPGFLWINHGGGNVAGLSLASLGGVPAHVWAGHFSLPVSAPPAPPVNVQAQCGTANAQTMSVAPTTTSQLCSAGTPGAVRGAGPWTWQCTGATATPQATCFAAQGAIKTYDMTGANLATIQTDISAANGYFTSADPAQQNTTVVLKFPAGTFDFSHDTSVNSPVYCTDAYLTANGHCPATNSIVVSGVSPGSYGRLMLLGAGPDQTKFIFNRSQTQFFGQGSNRITISGIALTQDQLTASQGTVANISPIGYPNYVVVDIPSGFPQMTNYPEGIYSTDNDKGHYLRRYSIGGGACNIDQYFYQLSYDTVTADPNITNRWWFHTNPNAKNALEPLNIGDLVGIKSQPSAGGQAYFFANSNDIMFDDVIWYRSSRGVFRSGTNYAQVYDSSIQTDPPINGQPICMSSSAGGPQFGQPNDPPTWGNVVDNFYGQNTGDDSIAIFNSCDTTDITQCHSTIGSSVSNTYITNSFARSLNFDKSPYPTPNTVDAYTLAHLFNCNSALPLTVPPTEPSIPGTANDPGGSDCFLNAQP